MQYFQAGPGEGLGEAGSDPDGDPDGGEDGESLSDDELASQLDLFGPLSEDLEALRRTAEQLLLIKCAAGKYSAVDAAIGELHSYEVPQVIALPITRGAEDYLAWITDSAAVPA